MMKKCRRCQETKDRSEFGKRASSKDGLDGRCLNCIKECSKQSSDKNRIKNSNGITISCKLCPSCRIEKTSDYFGTSPGSKDGLRNECKDCRNAKARYRYENDLSFRESESVRSALNYLEDREYIINRTKQWSKDNPDKKVEQRHRRIARLYGQLEFDLPKNFIEILREKQFDSCVYCSRNDVKLTVEHILPLSRGGKHNIANIALACATCNFSKHTKTLKEWFEHNQKLQTMGIVSHMLVKICDNISKMICKYDA